jgi:hypothetical protein
MSRKKETKSVVNQNREKGVKKEIKQVVKLAIFPYKINAKSRIILSI